MGDLQRTIPTILQLEPDGKFGVVLATVCEGDCNMSILV